LSNIRVTYSGLISFTISIASVFTGLIFTIIVTRRLTPDEFGTWALIGTLIGYFLISEKIISFWTTRQIARNEDVGKTSIASSLFFSLLSIPVYLLVSYAVSETSNADLDTLLFGVFLIPVHFLSQTLAGINRGFKPQLTGYGLLVFETMKIPGALSLVFFLELGVEGAIISVTLAYVVSIIVQGYLARQKLKGKLKKSVLKRWFKLSWLPGYSHIATPLLKSDIVLYSIISGSVIGVAYFSISMTIALLILHAQMVTQALYPKLLAKGGPEYIKENYTLLMYFSIPLFGLAIIFSKPGLFALNPVYEFVYPVVIILAFKTFFLVLRESFGQILRGIETVDIVQNPKFSHLLKSKLFFVPSVRLVQAIIFVAVITTTFLILNNLGATEIEIVTWWAIIVLGLEIPFFIYMLIQVQRNVEFSFPFIKTAKYFGATLAFVLVFFVTSNYLISYEISIYDFLPGVIYQVIICVAVYLGLTYIIDEKTRTIFKGVINEIRSKSSSSNN